MKKIISILSATRAEYGLLKPIIKGLSAIDEFNVRIVVTGAHLSPEFGLTYREIEKDGFSIDEKIEILLSSDSPASISKSMGLALIGFADYFQRVNPFLLIVLGDRYETIAVALAAMNQRVPIVHLYGGETTEGAIDESIRHAITKLSYLHFTSTEENRKRVIQLGEHPERVYNVGAIGIENIKSENLLSKNELEQELGMSLTDKFALVTFHPVTLENNSSQTQIEALLDVCIKYSSIKFIFTKANADSEGRLINQLIGEYSKKYLNILLFASLGTVKYLSAMRYSLMVIGNSSSGLVEAPSFGIPTVNIGDRQKGRIQASSVINCEPNINSIQKAIEIALSEEFATIAKFTANPYGDGKTSKKIVEIIYDVVSKSEMNIKKSFYDYEENK